MSSLKNTITFHIFVIFCLSLSYSTVNGELNINKPSVKVVQGTHVDLVDCVDIYKQPAFDHPKLKDHKIQMKASFKLERMFSGASPNAMQSGLISHVDCPPGKVPILRSNIENILPDEPRQHVVVFQNKPDHSTYHGVAAKISVHNPSVGLLQSSAAQIWVQNGPETELNVIQAGWAVYPELYGDTKTRTIVHWTADGYETGCYNAFCPGFVQVNRKYHPGVYYPNISIYGGQQVISQLAILQDESSGNWWFIAEGNIRIGYWPKEIFSHLREGATVVRYGGVAQQSPDGQSPEMGNGQFPIADFGKSSYFAGLQAARDNYDLTFIDPHHITGDIDTTGCYGFDYLGCRDAQTGPAFTYGGPGGLDCGV